MNHKRKGPKSTRSGCLLCKPHKHQGNKKAKEFQTIQERKAQINEKEYNEDIYERD